VDKQEIIDLLTTNDFQLLENYIDPYPGSWGVRKWIKLHKNGTDCFFVIQKIFDYYRLVFFDSNGRHMSEPSYDTECPAIDELYNNVEDIYKKLSDIYGVRLLSE